jgi:diaminohydroxyphosphoribosylaminopyrimidine deaminase/5-amino-6-(5-phosphoribosylamino)uracil reductase
MAGLFARGVRSALLEGGPTLAGAFLAAGLVDQVVGYVAPKLLGAGAAVLRDAGVTTIGEAIDLDLSDVTRIGPDLRFTATLRQKES